MVNEVEIKNGGEEERPVSFSIVAFRKRNIVTFNRHEDVEGISRTPAIYVLICLGNEKKKQKQQRADWEVV